MADKEKELEWSPEFLNRVRAGFSDEDWESAWIELWNSTGKRRFTFNGDEAIRVARSPDEDSYYGIEPRENDK